MRSSWRAHYRSMMNSIVCLLDMRGQGPVLHPAVALSLVTGHWYTCHYRYLGNREALQQPPQQGMVTTEQPQINTHTEGGVATTNLNEVRVSAQNSLLTL